MAKQLPKGYSQLELFDDLQENIQNDNLLIQALRMIDYAEKGILVDENGNIEKDLNYDLQRMQEVFDSVEKKRVNAYTSGRSKKGGIDVRIHSDDIKAVLFKPIIRMQLKNPSIVESGRSQFKAIWNLTKKTLYDNLENLTEELIKRAFQNVKDEINAFERYILSSLSSNPKEWDIFINAILDQIPTAFGPSSP